jgi:hypothetical protein
MKKTHFKYILSIGIAVMPVTALAATNGTLKTIVSTIISYLNIALVLMMALAIVMFTFYVIKYFVLPNENRSEAGQYVMYSIIGFFVILSFWGIVNIVQNSFGLGNTNNTPGSWASFTSIFPGGSSGTTNNNYNPITNTGTNFGVTTQ